MMRDKVSKIAVEYLGNKSASSESRQESLQRKSDMICKFFGLADDGHMMTMSAIGADLGVSREAVRQTIDDFGLYAYTSGEAKREFEGIKAKSDTYVAYCLGSEGEISRSDALLTYRVIKYLLRDETIQEKRFSKKMYTASWMQVDVKSIQSSCVKQISHNGAVRINEICDEVFAEGATEHNICLVVDSLRLKGDDVVRVNTDTGVYAYFTDTGRNRLISRLKKIFFHFETVSVDKLRSALMRDMLRRDSMKTVLPPDEVILSICANVLKASKHESFVSVDGQPEIDSASNQYEKSIIQFIGSEEDSEEVAERREREIERAVKKSDSDAYGFSMAINHSPLIVRVRRGVYQLTGVVRAA